jgi:hypothetical protein
MRFLRELKREFLIGLFSELTAPEVQKAIRKESTPQL